MFGIIVLIVGLVFGVFMIQQNQNVRLGAYVEAKPENVRITNVTDSSFVVSWTTDKNTKGFVSLINQGNYVTQDSLNNGLTHYVVVENLKPLTEYKFELNSDGIFFDNNGINWSVKTGQRLLPNSNSITISGNVVSATNKPIRQAIVFVFINGSHLSTVTQEDGTWILPLSGAMNKEKNNYISISEDTNAEILVITGGDSGTTAMTKVVSSNPMPPIIIGGANDYRNIEVEKEQIPEASVIIPLESNESKFDFDEDN